MTLGVVGSAENPFSGRAWVRTFPHGEVELLYRSGDAPSELERLNEWLIDAKIPNRITRLAPPGYGSEPRAEHEDSAETNAERVARRARQTLRWSVKAIGCDQMLTLTYRANVTSYAETRAHLSKFLRLCRAEWPTFRHVAVPEIQPKRLAETGHAVWHWHLGVRGFVNYDKLRGFWWKAIGSRVVWSSEGKPVLKDGGETPGNVQGNAAKSRGQTRRSWQTDKLAGYLAKYIAKSVGHAEVDGKSYSVSRGLEWKVERYAVRAMDYAGVCDGVFRLLATAGVVAPFLWQSPERRVVWAAGRSSEPPRQAG